jgi:hypothetical protein
MELGIIERKFFESLLTDVEETIKSKGSGEMRLSKRFVLWQFGSEFLNSVFSQFKTGNEYGPAL